MHKSAYDYKIKIHDKFFIDKKGNLEIDSSNIALYRNETNKILLIDASRYVESKDPVLQDNGLLSHWTFFRREPSQKIFPFLRQSSI